MTLSVPLTASSIFEELLTLMQLRPDYVPHVEINQKSAPRRAIRILLGRNAIPTYQSAPENLKWLIEDEEPNHDRLECLDQIENLGILDLLGEYNPGNGNIILYDLLIRLCAEKLEIEYQHLYDIVLCHELSHSATHLGIDQAERVWACFGDAPSVTVEYFAQLYTHLLYAKNQRHEITAAMQKLASDQPAVYKSYFADISKDISDINSDLLHARQQIFPCGALQTYQARQTEKRGDGSMKEYLDAVSSWLKHSAESKGWKYLNYSHESDFAELWEIGTGVGERDKASPLLIDWNGFPDERPIFPKILEFITPLDWALAVAYKMVVANPTAPSLPQVIIVDRCSHFYPGSFFVEMRRVVADALPHVKIFSALGDDNEDALAFVRFLQSHTMPVKQPRLGQMQALRQAWIGYTVQSGDHHDLSNILGPLVLSTGFKDSSLRKGLWEDKSAQALLQKIKWSGMGEGEGKPQGKWFDFAQHADKIVRNRRVKVILIDDQSNQGWLEIVSAAVGAVRPDESQASESEIKPFAKSDVVDVFASTSYLAIKSRLEESGISDKEDLTINGDQRFKFSLTGDGAEILLLDLRLFMNEKKELGYFRWALGVAKNLKHANEAAFPGMDCDTLGEWIDKVEEGELANWRNKAKYLELLTLLPRILATIDMSLPIVIFSSTGRREVTEWLKDYRNIITIFNKPGFFGYANESFVEDTRKKFTSAMQIATSLLNTRGAVSRMLNSYYTPPIGKSEGKKYVEMFIDESGGGGKKEKGEFIVGGIVVVHGSEQQAQELHEKMGETSITLDGKDCFLRWCGSKSIPKTDDRADLIPQYKDDLKKILDAHCDEYFSVTLSADFGFRKKVEDDLGQQALDYLYLKMFQSLIDAVIFNFLPDRYACFSEIEYRIFAGTRMRAYDGQKVSEEDLWKRFGIWQFSSNNSDGKKLYRSLRPDSFIPTLLNIAQGRSRRISPALKPKGISGVMLSPGRPSDCKFATIVDSKWFCDTTKTEFFRHIHFFADNITNLALDNKDSILEDFFSGRLSDGLNKAYEAALDSSRMIDSGQMVDGLVLALAANQEYVFSYEGMYPDSIIKIVMKKAAAQFMSLSSEDYYQITRQHLSHSETDYSIVLEEIQRATIIGKYDTPDVEAWCVIEKVDPIPKAIIISGHDIGKKIAFTPSRVVQEKLQTGIIFPIRYYLEDNIVKFISGPSEYFKKKEKPKKDRNTQTDAPTSRRLNVVISEGKVPLQRTSGKKLPIGKNELQIIDKDSVGNDGLPYVVLAKSNGIACAVLSMKNPQVAKCEIGQIIVVKNMDVSPNRVRVSQSAYELSVLELETKDCLSVAQHEASHSSVGQSQHHLVSSSSDIERTKLNDQPAEQDMGDVVEETNVLSGRVVVLPGFLREASVEQIEKIVRDTIDAYQLSGDLIRIQVDWNKKRNGKVCRIECGEALFQWSQETKKQIVELGLPWSGAIPQ